MKKKLYNIALIACGIICNLSAWQQYEVREYRRGSGAGTVLGPAVTGTAIGGIFGGGRGAGIGFGAGLGLGLLNRAAQGGNRTYRVVRPVQAAPVYSNNYVQDDQYDQYDENPEEEIYYEDDNY